MRGIVRNQTLLETKYQFIPSDDFDLGHFSIRGIVRNQTFLETKYKFIPSDDKYSLYPKM